MTSPVVVEITAPATYALRLAVLRGDTPSADVHWADDDLPGTEHLGVMLDDDLVAVSTWIPRPHPDHPAARGVQVRGMATAPEHRGHGYGGLVLEDGVRRCFAGGHDLVWARARDTALTFYEHHGFTVVGRGYIDLTTQLPHHDIVRHAS
jgi:GNAT superfamily N-acetyltransferase